MKQKYLRTLLACILLIFLITAGVVVLAQSSASFDLSWHVVGSGGGESNSADFKVQGTIGQSIASPRYADSADFVVASGYWAVGTNSTVYLPLITKN